MRHVILTRYNLDLYDTENPEEWMSQRYPLFVTTRESVLSQEGDFEWVLCMDHRTPNRWLQEIITDHRMSILYAQPRDYWSHGWTITTRLDNDDIYLPGAVKAIQDCFVEKELVIDLRYEQLHNDDRYTSGRLRPNSPFLSLIENGAKRTCYARPHSIMGRMYRSIFASDEVLAYMVIHDNNLGNKIVGRKI